MCSCQRTSSSLRSWILLLPILLFSNLEQYSITIDIFKETCEYTITSGDREKVHLFSSRTQKLSFSSSKILGWWRPGKIEHCWLMLKPTAWGGFFLLYIVYLIIKFQQCLVRFTHALFAQSLSFLKICLKAFYCVVLTLASKFALPVIEHCWRVWKHPREGAFLFYMINNFLL